MFNDAVKTTIPIRLARLNHCLTKCSMVRSWGLCEGVAWIRSGSGWGCLSATNDTDMPRSQCDRCRCICKLTCGKLDSDLGLKHFISLIQSC